MSENRVNPEGKQNNEQYIRTLQRLQDTAEQQNKTDYVDALKAAIKALQEDSPDRNGDDMRLSGTASDQLLQLAQQVREGTVTPQQKHQAASYLATLAGGKG